MLIPAPLPANPEDLRPQFHFTAPKGWLNDPNGLVYQDGKYHLFYQHNPFGTQWGNMTWGHAVSKDLVRWEHLPHALEPDAMGTMYSGSAIIDRQNLLGKGADAMVLFYTASGGENDLSKGKPYTQCLAYSTDGQVFTKLGSNSILGHIADGNRDPKVVWHEPTKSWIMALYLTADRFGFYGSKNLTTWTPLSEFRLRGSNECPDFFELAVDGDAKRKMWVFWGADGKYQVGDFDGVRFNPRTAVLESYFGNTAYAAQTYSNVPDRCIQIAWMRGSEFPGTPWNQQMAFPNELTLRTTDAGPRLCFWPVSEVESLRKEQVKGVKGFYPAPSGLMDITGSWQVPKTGKLNLSVNGISVEFDAETRSLKVLDRQVQVPIRDGKLSLRALADRTSLELYVQKGEIHMPFFVLPVAGAEKGVRVNSGLKGSVSVWELAR